MVSGNEGGHLRVGVCVCVCVCVCLCMYVITQPVGTLLAISTHFYCVLWM